MNLEQAMREYLGTCDNEQKVEDYSTNAASAARELRLFRGFLQGRVTTLIGTCKDCQHWEREGKAYSNEVPGLPYHAVHLAYPCHKAPFDARGMKPDECGIECGHDGAVYFGAEYGCVHFEARKPT
jgi:hypothetical protein